VGVHFGDSGGSLGVFGLNFAYHPRVGGHPCYWSPNFLYCRVSDLFQEVQLHHPLADRDNFCELVIVVDFFVVELLINRSLDMFASLLGTWIPIQRSPSSLASVAKSPVGLSLAKTRGSSERLGCFIGVETKSESNAKLMIVFDLPSISCMQERTEPQPARDMLST